MKLKSLRNVAIAAAMCTLVAGSVAATDNEQPQQDRKVRLKLRTFDVSFGGGSAVDYIDTVRREVPDANIVVMPGVSRAVLPKINLYSVTLDGALGLLRGRVTIVDGERIELQFNDISPGGASESIYTVSSNQFSTQQGPRQHSSLIVAIGDLVAGPFTAKKVLDAVDTAVQLLSDDGPRLRVSYHAETSLLIARGTPQQIEAVEDVIDQLGIAAAQAADAKRRQAAMDQMQTRQGDLETELARARDVTVDIERDRAQLDARVDLLNSELERKLDALDMRGAMIAQLESQIRDLQAQLDRKTATNTQSNRNPQ